MADGGVPFDQIGGESNESVTGSPRYDYLMDQIYSDEGRVLSPAEMQEYEGLVRSDREFEPQTVNRVLQEGRSINQSRVITQAITERLKAGQMGAHVAPVDPPVPMPPEMQRGSAVQAPTGPSGPGRYHIEIKQVPTNLSPSGRGWSIRQVFDK